MSLRALSLSDLPLSYQAAAAALAFSDLALLCLTWLLPDIALYDLGLSASALYDMAA